VASLGSETVAWSDRLRIAAAAVVDVAEFAAWIEQAGEGRLSSRQCGRGRINAESKSAVIYLGGSKERATLSLDVSAGTQRLRVAMNGEDDGKGSNDFNLFVYRGAQSGDAKPAGAETGPGQFAFCDIAAPSPGRWSVVVQRKQGRGNVQITATFAGAGRP
jgi:pre-peptidase